MSLSLWRRVLLVGGRRCAALGRKTEVWRPALANPAATGLYYSSNSNDSEADKVDEGLRLGDYPMLPWRSAQLNRQTGWWDNQDRRHKETILHEEDDALNVWMFDAVENNGKYTRWQALGQFTAAFAVLGLIGYLSYLFDAPTRNPALPRQYPFDNLYLERGGDPNVPPSERALKERVKTTYGNEYSA